MATAKRNFRKKPVKQALKSNKAAMLSVVTVRISDEEKERIDEIMRNLQITRYSDMMRMALHMVKTQQQSA
jgi:antitoxin component of RelBE/YafQ-DinJ toxin-antitoxin module